MKAPIRATFCVGVLAGLGAGCATSTPTQHACTDIFALIEVTAIDSTGTPVNGLVISDTIVRTHQGVAVPQNGLPESGRYVVFEDGMQQDILASGDAVKAAGTNGTLAFSANYVFAVADGCHVNKVSGPDTVVVH